MKQIALALTFFLVPSIVVAGIPDLVCQQLRVAHVDPQTLKSSEYDSRDRYRFKSGKLFLSSPERTEYLYGSVTESEPMRFVSGHKTILFEDEKLEHAVFVHVYKDEVRVSRSSCTRT